MNWDEVLDLWKNELFQFVVVIVVTFTALKIFQKIGLSWLSKKSQKLNHDQWVQIIIQTLHKKTMVVFIGALSLYAGAHVFKIPGRIGVELDRIALFVVALQFWAWFSALIEQGLSHKARSLREVDPSRLGSIKAISFVLHLILFIVLTLFALENFGVNIGTLVAGLGIGGIAVALAVQSILGDFLASLTIIFDKPFVVGDMITVGDVTGRVETIGVKTTRIRSLGGQETVMPNSKLLSSRIDNLERIQERRTSFRIGVTYQTSPEKLAQIPPWIKSLVEADKSLRFDRCHICALGPSSIDLELVYFVSGDYQDYMNGNQFVILGITALFARERIDFAYPTQTLFVERPAPS